MGLGGGKVLKGLAMARVPILGQAGLGEHVTLIYMTVGHVSYHRLDYTCPLSNQPSLSPPYGPKVVEIKDWKESGRGGGGSLWF